MTYRDAVKIKAGDWVFAPRTREKHQVLEAKEDNKEVFFLLDDVPHEHPKLFHHTAVQKMKTTEEIAGMYLADPKTRVFVNHNDETGEWRWAVEVKDSSGFWLDSFQTEAEANQYIAEHRLQIAG